MNKKIFTLTAQSASGKDLIADELEKRGYKILKSYTTRPRRIGEENTHIFINKEDVIKYKDKIIAYTKIGEFQYFSTREQLQECDIYIIDPKGINYLKENEKDIKIVSIFINVDDETRKQRALKRKDNIETMSQRFEDEKEQFLNFKMNAKFNYAVENYDLNKAVEIIEKIIEVERR